MSVRDVLIRAYEDPQWESEHLSKRPLRGPQAEIIQKIEKFIGSHTGGVMTIQCSRQTGKNDMAAILQRRHLWRNQNSNYKRSWIRTAPTHEPQIVNSKKRLEELMRVTNKNVIRYPSFGDQKVIKSEGYIWRLGSATVEFMSSGPHSNVVGATASECLDMDEAHKVDKPKFDEDFAPFTASTNAGTLLWGVAADGMDTIEAYRTINTEAHRHDLNLHYPCGVWMEVVPSYAKHVESRVQALGWDHPIIKTQYRLESVSHEGTFISGIQAKNLFDSDHERELKPRDGVQYEALIDLAAGNEDFNPDGAFDKVDTDSDDTTATDSTVVWIYEVTSQKAQNNLFPVLKLRQVYWFTGVPLPQQEAEIKDLLRFWRVNKVTVDGVGVGRQLAESLVQHFGAYIVQNYIANAASVSEDCFDLLARLNYSAVKMFRDDGSPEWAEFERQVGWTKYSSAKGKMSLMKPKADKHIDMVKALTYFFRNAPDNIEHQILTVEAQF